MMNNITDKHEDLIRLAHGGGGRLTSDLVQELFLKKFSNPHLAPLNDSATLDIGREQISFTTDSYVVSPLFFPGGNIGSLAVHGTVNDIAMSGARPRFISAGYIIEEGFQQEKLERIVDSMAAAAREASVSIVTGDTKVVPKGLADGLYINTAGIGIHECGPPLTPAGINEGDAILINGTIGDHGAAIISCRNQGFADSKISSDSAALHDLVGALQNQKIKLHALRDVTRGGLGGILAELAAQSQMRFEIDEKSLPVKDEVRGLGEVYGLEPIFLANEGKMVLFCPAAEADNALEIMRCHPLGKNAARIGRVTSCDRTQDVVVMRTLIGGQRVIDQPTGDLTPRIC
jgi:hydrogenase expression/formation protein HypE